MKFEKMKSGKTLVTPEMAKEWLTHNTHNRVVSRAIVEKYARDMKAGRWYYTNQGIGFDVNGVMTDGQHRLLACIMADTPFECLVVWNLPVEAQKVIDAGNKRSVPQQLAMFEDVTNATSKVAIANSLVAAIKGYKKISLSVDTAKEIIDLYDDEIEVVLADRGAAIKGLATTAAMAGMVIAAKVDLEEASEFKNKYYKGNNLSIGDPVMALRNFMLSQQKKGSGGQAYQHLVLNNATTALMAAFLNKPLKRLVSSTAGLEYFLARQKTYVGVIQECLDI
jgi:hypothetical protein